MIDESALPPLYANWISQLLGSAVPAEKRANCSACVMCAPKGHVAQASELFFDPRVKCCTYVPGLANFLVGRILADEDPAAAHGRQTVAARIAAGLAVTPLGLGQPLGFAVLYNKLGDSAFGRDRSLRCPHFVEESGGCGVWKHRASVCSTWFCKHVRGATGFYFWESLNRLLSIVETTLSRWCVLQLDPGHDALERLFALQLSQKEAGKREGAPDTLPDPAAQRTTWGRWHGREAEFYRECAQLVETLNWPQLVAICGPELQIAARLVQERFSQVLDTGMPERLKVGNYVSAGEGPGPRRIVTHSDYDPLVLPRPVLEALHHFDGRPVAEALAAISAEGRTPIDDAGLRTLVDFGVLVDAAPKR